MRSPAVNALIVGMCPQFYPREFPSLSTDVTPAQKLAQVFTSSSHRAVFFRTSHDLQAETRWSNLRKPNTSTTWRATAACRRTEQPTLLIFPCVKRSSAGTDTIVSSFVERPTRPTYRATRKSTHTGNLAQAGVITLPSRARQLTPAYFVDNIHVLVRVSMEANNSRRLAGVLCLANSVSGGFH